MEDCCDFLREENVNRHMGAAEIPCPKPGGTLLDRRSYPKSNLNIQTYFIFATPPHVIFQRIIILKSAHKTFKTIFSQKGNKIFQQDFQGRKKLYKKHTTVKINMLHHQNHGVNLISILNQHSQYEKQFYISNQA